MAVSSTRSGVLAQREISGDQLSSARFGRRFVKTPTRERFVGCSSWKTDQHSTQVGPGKESMGRPRTRRDEARRIKEAVARHVHRFLKRLKRGATTYRTSHGRKLTASENPGGDQS